MISGMLRCSADRHCGWQTSRLRFRRLASAAYQEQCQAQNPYHDGNPPVHQSLRTLVSTAYTNGRHSSLSRTEPTIYYLHRRRMAKHVPEFFERRRGSIGSTPMANHLVLGRRPPCSNVWTQIIWSTHGRQWCVSAQGVSAHPPAIQWRSNWIEIVSIWESISPTVAVSCL